MTRHRIAKVSDIPEGSMHSIEVGDRLICLANLKECGFRAIDDKCTHEDELLSEGYLWGNEVECPAHGSRFRFDTGAVTGLPATIPATVYEIEVQAGEIYVEI